MKIGAHVLNVGYANFDIMLGLDSHVFIFDPFVPNSSVNEMNSRVIRTRACMLA